MVLGNQQHAADSNNPGTCSPSDPAGETCAASCSLSPGAMRERKELIDRLVAQALDRPSPIPCGIQARFDQGTGIEAQLRALVDLEAECCAFLTMTVRTEDNMLVLEVTGAPEARSLIEALIGLPLHT